MNQRRLGRLAGRVAVLVSLLAPASAGAQSPDTILEWNRILLATLATPGATQPTIFFTRGPAVMHVAIFDALNSFDRLYTPYLAYVDVPEGASRDAAVAQAAHDTLVAMYPSQTAAFDAALAMQLGRLPADAAERGARAGAAAARGILELRADDGWQRRPKTGRGWPGTVARPRRRVRSRFPAGLPAGRCSGRWLRPGVRCGVHLAGIVPVTHWSRATCW